MKNSSKYNYLIEETCNRQINVRSAKLTIEFSWIKDHAGKLGKDLADLLATDAASDKDTSVIFDKIPKNTL